MVEKILKWSGRESCLCWLVPETGKRERWRPAVMSSVDYYRAEARRCRERAAESSDPGRKRSWLGMAAEYEELAKALEESQRKDF